MHQNGPYQDENNWKLSAGQRSWVREKYSINWDQNDNDTNYYSRGNKLRTKW